VLLVDDEDSVRSIYGRILRAAGFAVEESASGRAAAAALGDSTFDLVISDIGLPDMNGLEVLRCVRRADPDLPVVLMTGGGDLDSAVKAVELGALRYLLKPVAATLLNDTAEHGTRLRKMAKIKRRAFELYGSAAREQAVHSELRARFDQALSTVHMAYQPIVSCSERRVIAYEALVRNDEPSMRRPDLLFAAAEKLERLFELGRLIRSRVATTMQASDTQIFVNLHAHDLLDGELYATSSPLSKFARRVVLEVTERASLDAIGDLQSRFATLRELGFRLAVDDLGSGYAGLTSFAQIQPDVVKLDMSLIRNIHAEPTKRKLVESMTTLCRELGMQVIAEGVENSEERDALLLSGCDLLQGYLFAKPGAPFPRASFT
jgi:EAL domain-containing protein (putative c-di-GMP-specific phosphodiesterase class I)/ActR/RegA family two-component response regulator